MTKMIYIVDIFYLHPLEVIEKTLQKHRSYLQKGYESNLLISSGPKEPRDGGIIIAYGYKDDVDSFIENDPFNKNGLASYTIQKFHPVKYNKLLSEIID